MAKRILITGAFGQLGEAVTQELQSHFDLLATGLAIPDDFPCFCPIRTLDIQRRNRVFECVEKFDPDVILNLAAYTDVDGCEKKREQAWNVNVKGTENLLESVRTKQVKFIQISSDYIFEGRNGPYDESAVPNPINYYGKTKLAAENAVRGNATSWVILRTNVLYGASSVTKANFVDWVVQSLRAGTPIRVVNDQWGNPTWTGALAEAIKMAILLNVNGIFNYGGAEFLTRFEFARKIARVFDLDLSLITGVSTDDLKQEAQRPLKSGLVTEKVENVLGLRTYDVDYCLRKVREGVVA
ncbi:MAG: SDR family oxidoreductase [Candidatus Neomarinimicrobiota bacterium]